MQTSADNKRMKGKFYVKRPGRFRFDYARPSRQIVVSDGHYLAIQDLDLNNEDRVALDETPFRLLLRTDVDLVRDARIMECRNRKTFWSWGWRTRTLTPRARSSCSCRPSPASS